MALLVLNVLIIIAFVPMDYLKTYFFFYMAFPVLSMCLWALFATSFIYMAYVSYKNQLNMEYVSLVVVFGFISPMALKSLANVLVKFISSSFGMSVLYYVCETLSYWLPALLFMYFAKKLRQERDEVS